MSVEPPEKRTAHLENSLALALGALGAFGVNVVTSRLTTSPMWIGIVLILVAIGTPIAIHLLSRLRTSNARRSRRRQRIAALLVAVVAIGGLVFANTETGDGADRERLDSLLAQSRGALDTDVVQALDAAAEAAAAFPDDSRAATALEAARMNLRSLPFIEGTRVPALGDTNEGTALSPDGETLAVAEPGGIVQRSSQTGQIVGVTIPVRLKSLLTYSADGSRLFIDNEVYDATSRVRIGELLSPSGDAEEVIAVLDRIPAGIVVVGSRNAWLVDRESLAPLRFLHSNDDDSTLTAGVLSREGDALTLAQSNGNFRRIMLEDGVAQPGQGWIEPSFIIGRRMAAIGNVQNVIVLGDDGSLWVLSAFGKFFLLFRPASEGTQANCLISPDKEGGTFYTCDTDGRLKIWSSEGEVLRGSVGMGLDGPVSLASSGDGDLLVAVDRYGQMVRYDYLANADEPGDFGGADEPIAGLVLSDDSAVVARVDGTIEKWSLETYPAKSEFLALGIKVSVVAADPDANFIVVGGTLGELVVVRVADLAVVSERVLGPSGIADIGLSGDRESIVVSADSSSVLTVLYLADLATRLEIEMGGDFQGGDLVDISTDGATVFAARRGDPAGVKVIDVESGKEIGPIRLRSDSTLRDLHSFPSGLLIAYANGYVERLIAEDDRTWSLDGEWQLSAPPISLFTTADADEWAAVSQVGGGLTLLVLDGSGSSRQVPVGLSEPVRDIAFNSSPGALSGSIAVVLADGSALLYYRIWNPFEGCSLVIDDASSDGFCSTLLSRSGA